jgi:diaminopimelate decarboxylase
MTAASAKTHAPIRGFETKDHRLQIGGMPVSRLADRIGRTPFFAYSRELISRRVDELRAALPEDVLLHYAVKANPMPAVVQHLAGLVDGFDIASGGELKVVLDTKMPVDEISFAGPGKTNGELREAVAGGIVINLESPREMERIAEAGEALGRKPKVAVRVNPDFELKSAGMQMSGGPKQFGVDAETVPQMLGRMKDMDLDFRGFHIFSGSQNLKADQLIEAQRKTVELAVSLSAHAPAPVTMLNIGGGFGIPYFPGDEHLDVKAVGDKLGELMPKVAAAMPEARVIIELGRYMVGEAGIYVTRVIDRKVSRGQVFLVTDGGLHHHLPVSGNFGQVLRKNYPLAIADKMDLDAVETVDVVGCLCTPLDRLGDKCHLPRAEEGDLIVIFHSGAYGPTASPASFLSHEPAAEVLV